MIKQYHEAPIAAFEEVQKHTDGDYALVHLFETNPVYLGKFVKAVRGGRDVILDNSLFELRTAFDPERFAGWITYLKPTWYIVPDAWKDGKKTAEMFYSFTDKHPNLPGKKIGVAQGKTFDEVAECYRAIASRCDMIAFNLDFSSIFYDSFNTPEVENLVPYCVAMSMGRRMMLERLSNAGIIDQSKPHHLLGCGVPQEAAWYPREWTWIRSLDTCTPVMAAMKEVVFESDYGRTSKPSDKMCDHIDDALDQRTIEHIIKNIKVVREWCN